VYRPICDPAADPDPPGTRPWSGAYDYDIAFRERVSERFKVVLSRPSRCLDNGEAVWYGRVAFFTTERILRIPAGGLFSSYKPDCGLSEPKPV
jgi:hypothetical protein